MALKNMPSMDSIFKDKGKDDKSTPKPLKQDNKTRMPSITPKKPLETDNDNSQSIKRTLPKMPSIGSKQPLTTSTPSTKDNKVSNTPKPINSRPSNNRIPSISDVGKHNNRLPSINDKHSIPKKTLDTMSTKRTLSNDKDSDNTNNIIDEPAVEHKDTKPTIPDNSINKDVNNSVIDDSMADMLDSMLAKSTKNTEQAEADKEEQERLKALKEHEKDPIITSDGRRLSEILATKTYAGTNKEAYLNEKLDDYRKVNINGKELTDGPALKGVKELQSQVDEDEARRKASKRYLQKRANYSEEEKQIMRNLGLTAVNFKKVLSPESKLTTADKQDLIALGVKGPEKYFRGKRIRVGKADHDIIEFLAKGKMANTRCLARLKGDTPSTANRRLTRLKEMGLVRDREVLGMGTVWYLTSAGMAFSGYSLPTFGSKKPKASTFPPIIGANHVASCLWTNKINILCLDDFPYNGRHVYATGGVERGENLVFESEIRSSMARENSIGAGPGNISTPSGGYGILGERSRNIWHEWDVNGRVGESPELGMGNEFLYTLYPESGLTASFHIPDLVVVRDRENNKPKDIAVEVELSIKSLAHYQEILMAYKLDEHLYEKVVWVTSNNQIVRRLIEAAKNIGFTKFDIVPLVNEEGIYKEHDIWYI